METERLKKGVSFAYQESLSYRGSELYLAVALVRDTK